VQNEPRIHNREWAKEIGLVSFAGYQLRPPGENTLGVLALFSKQNITVDEDAQLDSLSNTITRFIQMARVDEELRQHRDLLEDRVKERTEELARKNAEMERFVYTVSHDLRTPLISMSGFLGFLKQDAEKGDMKRVDEDFRIVSDAITKMDKLLQDTLELSRIGRIVNPPENVPFGEIVSEALAQSPAKLSSKNVRVTVEDDLPIVQVDRIRLVEVLVNLLENSVKYMGDQPQPRIEIGKRLDCENMVLFVRDNGIGIEPIRHDKVFELFYKVDKKSEGSGAGLAIVKKIIEVHGGKIWIESDLGKGCTVCFTLEPAKPG
jgi:signal transduction histidine kinase